MSCSSRRRTRGGKRKPLPHHPARKLCTCGIVCCVGQVLPPLFAPRAASSIYSMGATERAMGVRTVFSLVVAPDDDAADSEEDNAAERP